MMTTRTRELLDRHRLAMGVPYRWNLDDGAIQIGDVSFRLTTIGTVSEDSFLWAWANDAIPASGKQGLDKVRAFGAEHDLALLTESCLPGGLAQAKECLAIAGRVLDGHGVWIDPANGVYIAFVLFERTLQ